MNLLASGLGNFYFLPDTECARAKPKPMTFSQANFTKFSRAPAALNRSSNRALRDSKRQNQKKNPSQPHMAPWRLLVSKPNGMQDRHRRVPSVFVRQSPLPVPAWRRPERPAVYGPPRCALLSSSFQPFFGCACPRSIHVKINQSL